MSKKSIKDMLDNLSESELQEAREYLVNRFTDLITEIAFDRKTVMRKIDGLEKQINLHLIKIVRYDDSINFNKHLNDIVTWLIDIQELDVGKKNKKLPEQDYFKLLFSNRFTDESNSKHIIDLEKGSLRNYQNLPKIRTAEETIKIVYEIQKQIAKKLAYNDIYDIEDYIKGVLK